MIGRQSVCSSCFCENRSSACRLRYQQGDGRQPLAAALTSALQCAAARFCAGERLLTTVSRRIERRLNANLLPETVSSRQTEPCSSDTPRFVGVIGERPAFQRPL
jgi:hypothetical protein